MKFFIFSLYQKYAALAPGIAWIRINIQDEVPDDFIRNENDSSLLSVFSLENALLTTDTMEAKIVSPRSLQKYQDVIIKNWSINLDTANKLIERHKERMQSSNV